MLVPHALIKLPPLPAVTLLTDKHCAVLWEQAEQVPTAPPNKPIFSEQQGILKLFFLKSLSKRAVNSQALLGWFFPSISIMSQELLCANTTGEPKLNSAVVSVFCSLPKWNTKGMPTSKSPHLLTMHTLQPSCLCIPLFCQGWGSSWRVRDGKHHKKT